MNNKKEEKKLARKTARQAVRGEQKKLTTANKVQLLQGNRAKSAASSYLLSILDPDGHGEGSKVPDLVTVPSQPLTNRFKFTQANGAVGTGTILAFAVNCPYTSYIIGTVATNGNITWGTWQPAPWAAAMAGSFQANRAVSAVARCQVQGSSNNNQGRLVWGFYPTSSLNRGGFSGTPSTLPPITTPNIENSTYGASKNVASNGNAAEVRFIPTDMVNLAYVPTQTNVATTPFGVSPPGGIAGLLVVGADGLAAGVNLEWYYTENLECIPQTGNTSVASATPSRSDPLEMSHVANVIGENPTLATAQSAAVSKGIPNQLPVGTRVTQPQQGPSFMDKMMGWVDKGIEVGKKLTPVAASLLALL